jgi:hypothetical protein
MRRVNWVARTALCAGIMASIFVAANSWAQAASSKGKPMIPVQVSIEPTVAKMKPQNIKPGDVVEFKVSARAPRGTDEMTIEITLLDGTELVSGDLKWSGKVSRNEEKRLVVSVRAPAKGTGRVMASVTVLRDGKSSIAKQAIYTLGSTDSGAAGKPAPATRRDNRGRTVVEY